MNKAAITDTGEKVLLLGSTGLLGSVLKPFLDSAGYDVQTHARSNDAQYQVDLSDSKKVCELLDGVQPKTVVNLVGLTDVDQCQEKPNHAYLANVRPVENIAGWIKRQTTACHFITISTDQVYDGDGIHQEDDVTLTNCYAFSKYAGELAAATVPSTILRTNFFGRSYCSTRSSLSDWLYQSLSDGREIQVFSDVKFNPVSMQTISEMIALAIREKNSGVFNLGSRGGLSKADFAFSLSKALNLSAKGMTRATSDQATFLKSYRPKDMRMQCSKFETTFGVSLPCLEDEIISVAKEYHA